ncbi:MAG: hypothetical protein NTX36_12485 [Proteobacteria bacterium]|nr:hypothetical protein [Pseudomonadota bacterium]
MKPKNFMIDPEVHKQLKLFAVRRDIRIGDAIKLLLDKNSQEIKYSCGSPGQNTNEIKGELK